MEVAFILDLICIEFFKKINMKKLKIFSILVSTSFVIGFTSSLSLFSCDSNTYQDLEKVVVNPTYSANIEPVITTKCTGCHSGGSQYPDLQNYDQVKDASIVGKLLCRIKGECGEIMPTSGKLPQATIDMFQRWADQGYAKEIANPTYTKDVKPVMTASCTSCHSGGNQFPDLENYAQVKDATLDGNLLCRINGECGQIMPTSGKMPQATIDMIQLWATKDYPN